MRAFLRLEWHFFTTGVSWYEAKTASSATRSGPTWLDPRYTLASGSNCVTPIHVFCLGTCCVLCACAFRPFAPFRPFAQKKHAQRSYPPYDLAVTSPGRLLPAHTSLCYHSDGRGWLKEDGRQSWRSVEVYSDWQRESASPGWQSPRQSAANRRLRRPPPPAEAHAAQARPHHRQHLSLAARLSPGSGAVSGLPRPPLARAGRRRRDAGYYGAGDRDGAPSPRRGLSWRSPTWPPSRVMTRGLQRLLSPRCARRRCRACATSCAPTPRATWTAPGAAGGVVIRPLSPWWRHSRRRRNCWPGC